LVREDARGTYSGSAHFGWIVIGELTRQQGGAQPCPPDCRRHATACPERKGGGLVFTRPKTKKSTNPVPIPPPFIPYLYEHKKQQEEMRAVAGDEWQEFDALFTRPDGRPLDPRADWEEFKELLEEAGITDRRLYDGSRHTAGTILNELEVDMPTIMEILRHTQISQTSGTSRADPTSPRTRCAVWEITSCPHPNPPRNPLLRPQLRPGTAGRPALSAAEGSGKSKSPRSRRVSPEASTEPPSGFEPETYALRARQTVPLGCPDHPSFHRSSSSSRVTLAGDRGSFTGFTGPSVPTTFPTAGHWRHPDAEAEDAAGHAVARLPLRRITLATRRGPTPLLGVGPPAVYARPCPGR